MKLRPTVAGYAHWCPACQRMHVLPDAWAFDGNLEAPTYTPSFKHTFGPQDARKVCHYILTAGVLNFCADCTHGMKAQAIPLPDIPEHLRDTASRLTP